MHLAMKTFVESEGTAAYYMASALDGRQWPVSRYGLFSREESIFYNRWLESWVGPRDDLDSVKKRCFSLPWN
jgi:hypothetical protein